jgi:solute carrier family 50 protein (sugar transporter)
MIFVNTTGFACFLLYNLFFISMAAKNQSLLRQYGLLGAILFVLLYGPTLTSDRLQYSGLIACVCGLAFFAAPLFQLKRIFADKDVSSLPFWMIFFSFITSVLWLFFGILVNDNFIKVRRSLRPLRNLIQNFNIKVEFCFSFVLH